MSSTFIEVLNSLSLDLVNKVEKSVIKLACVFQYKIPSPMYVIYSLLFGTFKTAAYTKAKLPIVKRVDKPIQKLPILVFINLALFLHQAR